MADVTGPISTLPGSMHAVPEGTVCDWHPDRPAVKRIQGETDSFGSEMNDVCQECYDDIRKSESAHEGFCDWCKAEVKDLRPRRDYEEGLSGPVYYVCGECVRKDHERIKQEEAEDDRYYNDY